MENNTSKQIILFATENAHKVQEVRNLLSDFPFEIQTTDYPEIIMPPEDAETFEGNALIKARYVSEITKHLVVADDSVLKSMLSMEHQVFVPKDSSKEQTDDANNKNCFVNFKMYQIAVLDLSVPLLL